MPLGQILFLPIIESALRFPVNLPEKSQRFFRTCSMAFSSSAIKALIFSFERSLHDALETPPPRFARSPSPCKQGEELRGEACSRLIDLHLAFAGTSSFVLHSQELRRAGSPLAGSIDILRTGRGFIAILQHPPLPLSVDKCEYLSRRNAVKSEAVPAMLVSPPSHQFPVLQFLRLLAANPFRDFLARDHPFTIIPILQVLIVQWIEPRFPKPLIRVRISVGAPFLGFVTLG